MRTLPKIALILLLILGLIAGGIALFLDRAARVAVEHHASLALDVPTTVDSISIRPFRGEVAISDLEISNPEGFSDKPFLAMQDGSLKVKVASLMKDVVEVPTLELSGLAVRLESRGSRTNYGVIADNLERTGAGEKSEPAGEAKRFIIGDLVIRGVKIDGDFALDSPLGKSTTQVHLELPPIHLHKLRDGKPSTVGQIAEEIFKAILEAATSEQIGGLPAALVQDIRGSISGMSDVVVELGGEVGGVLKDIGKGVETDVKDVLEGAKDLLKKKD